MSKPLVITTQVLVNDEPLDTLNEDAVLDQIRFQEQEIAREEKLANRPEFLTERIEARKAGIEKLLKLVNERKAAAKAAEPVTRAEFEASK